MGNFINEEERMIMEKFNIPETLLEKLTATLDIEYNFYEDLKSILIEERNALVQVDNDKLATINFRKESLLINIIEIKNRRTELLNKIGQLINIDPNDITLTFLSSNFSKYSETFNEFKLKFKAIGNKIKSLNEINKHVINSSLQFIKSSLNIIFQSSNKAVYTNYGKVTVNKAYQRNGFYSQKV